MAHPPARALALVAALAPRNRRDSIVGDLLEEYHQAQVPQHGPAAADRWFVRQALGFLWRAAAVPGGLLGALLTVRTLIDVVAPVPDLADRAAMTTYAAMALFAVIGFRLGLSTRRVAGAIVTAVAATMIGAVASYAAALALLGIAETIVHPGAAALGGLREGLDIPAHVIAVIGSVVATAAAAAGRAFPKWPFLASS